MPKSKYISDWALKRFADFKNPAYASLADLLGDSLPTERYAQMNSRQLLNKLIPQTVPIKVLDVGCGRGKTAAWFHEQNPQVDWHGIEIAESYNVDDLESLPKGVVIYDGKNIPFKEREFDFVFSNQVFEHVRYPELLLNSIHRVIQNDGIFFGSLSGGEPYHWHSLFHFSALGWKTVLEDNGFKLLELYSGVDALSLLLHHWSQNRKDLGQYFKLSVLNQILMDEEKTDLNAIRYENALKLAFTGHLVFVAQKQTVA